MDMILIIFDKYFNAQGKFTSLGELMLSEIIHIVHSPILLLLEAVFLYTRLIFFFFFYNTNTNVFVFPVGGGGGQGGRGNYWVLDTDYDSYSIVWSCTDYKIFNTRECGPRHFFEPSKHLLMEILIK